MNVRLNELRFKLANLELELATNPPKLTEKLSESDDPKMKGVMEKSFAFTDKLADAIGSVDDVLKEALHIEKVGAIDSPVFKDAKKRVAKVHGIIDGYSYRNVTTRREQLRFFCFAQIFLLSSTAKW